MRKFVLLSLAILLSACGTTAGLSQEDLSRPIAAGDARIIVERDSSLLYLTAPAKIDTDGYQIASLGAGGAVSRDMKAGHTITLSVTTPLASGRSSVRFDIKPRHTYKFVVSPRAGKILSAAAFGMADDAVSEAVGSNSGYFQIEQQK